MEIPIIYVNKKHHTGDIHEASQRLLETCNEITEVCVSQVRDINGKWSGQYAEEFMKRYCGNDALSSRLKKAWSSDELRVVCVLRDDLAVLKPDARIDVNLRAKLNRVESLKTPFQALSFWRQTQARLEYLMNPQIKLSLGSVKYPIYSLIESRVLNHALSGVYLVPRKY